MPSDSITRLALNDIRENGKLAQQFVAGLSFERFRNDRLFFYAVTRVLEIVVIAGLDPSPVTRGLDPRVHPFRKQTDARVKPAHDGGKQRFNSTGARCKFKSLFQALDLIS
jgi:hypothetical protein